MPRTKKLQSESPQHSSESAVANGPPGDVLTLAEAAAYLKLSEADVLRLVREQALPARRLEDEWRFLKAMVQQWLSAPAPEANTEGIWAVAGSWKDDPYLDEMLKEIYRERGRPMTEE